MYLNQSATEEFKKKTIFKRDLKVVTALANLRSAGLQGFYSKRQDVRYDLKNQKFGYLSFHV